MCPDAALLLVSTAGALRAQVVESGPVTAITAGRLVDPVTGTIAVKFLLKNGIVFKQDGVMTPAAFFNGGPVNGYNAR